MRISVIIPTYKPQGYLWQCLDSLCNQTFPKENFELILVLNGCKEPYEEQIKAYIEQHSDINWNYIQTDERGVSNARNMALDVAQGEYVTFIDDDDYVSEAYLEELYDKVTPSIVSLAYAYAFDDGSPEYQKKYSVTSAYDYCTGHNIHTLSSIARKYFSGPCMKLIPMSFIQNRRFDTHFKNGEDSLFMFLISDKIHNVSFTSKNAIYYRRFRTMSASTKPRSKWQRVVNSFRCAREYTKIYLSGGYNNYFYYSRIAAELRFSLNVIFKG